MDHSMNIAQKAGNLFRTTGIRNITMDDVANELGISKKTLYKNVTDKNGLIDKILDNEFAEVKRQAAEINKSATNPVEALIKLNAFVVKYLKSINPTAVFDLRKQYHESYDNAADKFSELFASMLRENINQGKALGLYHNHIDCDVIISLHSVKYSQLQNLWEPDMTPEKLFKIAQYYLQGLVTEKGNELLVKHISDFNNYLK
jgi:TetR/AcrR family transcriptional regulator, cholesterol catabolism regulator